LFTLVIAAQPSAASSPDAWDEFRQKVATNCVALAVAGNFRAATARVDPFGTESYGVALITGTLKKGRGPGERDLRHGQENRQSRAGRREQGLGNPADGTALTAESAVRGTLIHAQP